jgi:hypothetical protein
MSRMNGMGRMGHAASDTGASDTGGAVRAELAE